MGVVRPAMPELFPLPKIGAPLGVHDSYSHLSRQVRSRLRKREYIRGRVDESISSVNWLAGGDLDPPSCPSSLGPLREAALRSVCSLVEQDKPPLEIPDLQATLNELLGSHRSVYLRDEELHSAKYQRENLSRRLFATLFCERRGGRG